VGDADQMIYGWRGADLRNILDFEKDYPDAKTVLLEQNYRSTKNIIEASNAIIDKNVMRKKKVLFTENDEGEKISVYAGLNEGGEAQYIAWKAKELIESGVNAREIAVLYRANFQSRALEEAFLSTSVPYQLLGVRFFERKEVKDLISYIRLALNPDSLSDLKRVINTPPRGIGKISFLKIASGKEGELSMSLKSKLQSLRTALADIKNQCEINKCSVAVKFAIQKSGIEDFLRQDKTEGEERMENIRELVTLASRYDIFPPLEGVERFLEDASLASDQDELEKDTNAVKLMTVHSSKGLEFDYVFISGLEDDLFPHKRLSESRISENEQEEERRLFYVALTRARKKVFLTYAQSRTIYGSTTVNMPSEFITDIDDSLLETEAPIGGEKEKFIWLDF
jgi:DNA helicase-2/ATP-dependent DNA helicase PcrA